MKRLTRRCEDCKGYFKALDHDCTCNRECPRLWEHMLLLSDRLAAYEDTGLEPEEIKGTFTWASIEKLYAQGVGVTVDHLRSLVQAEQEGRLIVLPTPAKEGGEKPECFESCTGIWCHGYEGFGCEDHHDHCKKCWYFEDFVEAADAALESGGG